MSKILIPTSDHNDWKQFLADPEKQWKRGYSAMATALSWEEANGLPIEIANIIGNSSELLLAIPEHKVALPGGARESQCDVFALVKHDSKIISLAVEAKVNEPFGPTIGEWMTGASKGKIKRIEFICELLGLNFLPPDNLRYQLFHRTASAILEARRFNADESAMIIQSFSQEHKWFEDFSEFCKLFEFKADINNPYTLSLPDKMPLTIGWAVGSPKFI